MATWNTMLGFHIVQQQPTYVELDSLMRDMKTMNVQSGSSWGSPTRDEDEDDQNRWRGSSTEDEVDEAPPLLSESEEEFLSPSCQHNKWDNLRTKNEIVALRCRVCSIQWKVPVEYIRTRKCESFVKSCPIENCTALHIYKYKLPAKTRSKLRQKMAKAREVQASDSSSQDQMSCTSS